MRNLINEMEKPASCHVCLYSRIDFKNVEWCLLTQKDIPCDCPFETQYCPICGRKLDGEV